MLQLRNQLCIWLLVFTIPLGCTSGPELQFDDAHEYYESIATKIEQPIVTQDARHDLQSTPAPITVRGEVPTDFWQLSLEEAIQIALTRSQVIRDNSGRVVNAPHASSTVYDVALQESNPRTGPEAALSAFDAQWNSGMYWERNELYFNNILIGGGNSQLKQDAAHFQAEVAKTNATGGQLAVRNRTNYNFNRALFNTASAVYDTAFEVEARQPLFQGAGIDFNRIAGPNAVPGTYNGIVLARMNTDISLADFEIAVRDLLRDVEITYWDLYFSYRDLDAKMVGKESALETWRLVQRKLEAGAADEEMEARAREQYFLYDGQVIDALGGTTFSGTVVVTSGGVYSNERKLRSLLGLSASDGRLIRPLDEPNTADTLFSWNESLQDSLVRRAELRKQRWVVRRRELELTASNNFLQSRFDLVGLYRWNGLGSDLIGNAETPQGSAFGDLFHRPRGDWNLGMQWSTPIGNRIGHTAVRNAEWSLARERVILREQELQVTHELSRSFSELDRAYVATRAAYNRALAAREQLEQIRKKYAAGAIPLDPLLDAQRRATQADSAYYRALVDYNTGIAAVCRARGTLLDYYQVSLAEGPWVPEAYRSAAKQARRFKTEEIDYTCQYPCPVSQGEYPQLKAPTELIPLPSTGFPAGSYEEVVPPLATESGAAFQQQPIQSEQSGQQLALPQLPTQKWPAGTPRAMESSEPSPQSVAPAPPSSSRRSSEQGSSIRFEVVPVRPIDEADLPGGPAMPATPPKPQSGLQVPEFE